VNNYQANIFAEVLPRGTKECFRYARGGIARPSGEQHCFRRRGP